MIFSKPRHLEEGEVAIRPELIVPWQEIIAVTIAMLGAGFLFGTCYGLTHPAGSFYLLISNRFFLVNSAFQSAMLAAFLFFLRRRGWRPEDFRIRLGWLTSLRGLELLVFTYGGFLALAFVSHFVIWLLAGTRYGDVAKLFIPEHVPIPPGGIQLSWIVLLVSTILNAFFEELVYMGYAFNLWAAKYGARAAVLFTVFARMAVHTYQGTEHVLAIAVWAVLFGLWYRYHREVWPLILAHLTIDLVSFGLLKLMHGAP